MDERIISASTIRKSFALRVRVAEMDARLGDKGSRVDGVQSCRPIIESAATEIESLRSALDAAVEKLQAASFNTGCSMTGYVIDKAIEIIQPEVTA